MRDYEDELDNSAHSGGDYYKRRSQWKDWRDFEISPRMQELVRQDRERSRLCIEFQQNGEVVGVTELKDFSESGEVPSSWLAVDQVKYFNEQPSNVKDGVTAHLIFHTGPV